MKELLKELEIPEFHLHYEIQVKQLAKTEDSEDFSIRIIQHYEGKSKVIENMISIAGYRIESLTTNYFNAFATLLNNHIAVSFKEGVKYLSENWDKLDDMQRLPYQMIENIVYLPIIEKTTDEKDE